MSESWSPCFAVFDCEGYNDIKKAYNWGCIIVDVQTFEIYAIITAFLPDNIAPCMESAKKLDKIQGGDVHQTKVLMNAEYMKKNGYPVYWYNINAVQDLEKTLCAYGVKTICAYNCKFDKSVLENMGLSKIYNWFDIRELAIPLVNSPDFLEWAKRHDYTTETGRAKSTAETVYRYLFNCNGYTEVHEGQADALDELDILRELLEKGYNTPEKYNYLKAPIIKPPLEVEKIITTFSRSLDKILEICEKKGDKKPERVADLYQYTVKKTLQLFVIKYGDTLAHCYMPSAQGETLLEKLQAVFEHVEQMFCNTFKTEVLLYNLCNDLEECKKIVKKMMC